MTKLTSFIFQKRKSLIKDQIVSFVLGYLFICMILFSIWYLFIHTGINNNAISVALSLNILLSIFFAISVLVYVLLARFEHQLRDIESSAKVRWLHDVESAFLDKRSPLISFLESRDSVASASRELIINRGKEPIWENAILVFIGAVSIQSSFSTKEDYIGDREERRSPVQIYQGAMEEAMSAATPMLRIVRLLLPEDFKKRSSEQQLRYLSWLRNQAAQLKKNPNYILIDNKRAPMWASTGALLFSRFSFFQFTNSTGVAYYIKDQWVSRSLLRTIMRELKGAQDSNKVSYRKRDESALDGMFNTGEIGTHKSLVDLNEMIEGLLNLRKEQRLINLEPLNSDNN